MQSRRTARALIAGLVAVAAAAAGGAQSAGAKHGRAAQPLRGQRQGQHRRAGPRGLRPDRESPSRRRLRHHRHAPAGQGPARQGRDRAPAHLRPQRHRRPAPLTQPDHGYNVFRPWSLKPAPCPHDVLDAARAAEEVVPRPRVALPGDRQGGDDRPQRSSASRSWPTRSPTERAATRDGSQARRCSTSRPSTPASGSRPRSTAGCSSGTSTNRRDSGSSKLLSAERAVVHPDDEPGRLRLHLHRQGHRLWRKNLRDVNGDGVIDPTTTASTPTATGPRSGTTTSRARPNDPSSETYHGSGAGLRARGPGLARAAAAPAAAVPHRLPLRREADPVPGGLAGGDASRPTRR